MGNIFVYCCGGTLVSIVLLLLLCSSYNSDTQYEVLDAEYEQVES